MRINYEMDFEANGKGLGKGRKGKGRGMDEHISIRVKKF